ALGCALARVNRVKDAIPHLRAAVNAQPFDIAAARALAQALADTCDWTGREGLAADRRLLNRASPTAIPIEPWFAAPPSSDPPAQGHWVVIQPWEFGSLPKAWLGPLLDQVDEVWAYSRHVRDSYIASGFPADRVHVVPLGVDPAVFHKDVPPIELPSAGRFRF